MPKNRVDIQLGTSKAKPTARALVKASRYSLEYWVTSVRRLSVMTDKPLKPSQSRMNRYHLMKVLKVFMAPYEGLPEQERPLLDAEVETLKRGIAGGILSR